MSFAIVYRHLLVSSQAIVLTVRKLGVNPVLPANRVHADISSSARLKIEEPTTGSSAASTLGFGAAQELLEKKTNQPKRLKPPSLERGKSMSASFLRSRQAT